jgi:glycopeptide antibiotics resistance protein
MTQFLAFATSSVGFALIACLAVTIAWLVLRSAGPRFARTSHDLLVVLSVVTILVLTLRPGNLGALRATWQLLPFGDLLAAIPDPGLIRLALADIVTNILLFAPLGAAIALRWPGASTRRVVLSAAAVSAAIEMTQGVMAVGRTAQSTDVLMNVLGAWLGWSLVRRVLVARASRADRLSVAVPRRR